LKSEGRVGVSGTALAVALVAVVVVAGVGAYLVLAPSGKPSSSATSSTSTTSTPTTALSVAVAAVPASPLISPGETQNYSSIQVSASGSGLNGTASVSAFAPTGLSLALNQTTIPLSEGGQSIPFVLTASSGISPGNYTVTIQVSSGAAQARNQTFVVRVVPMLVVMLDVAFHPSNITVPKGTAVTWLNLDSTIGCCDPGYHTVSFTTGANATSPVLKRFDSYTYAFGADGVFDYYCTIHPYMKGQVTVTG
jgi:plastocyanin